MRRRWRDRGEGRRFGGDDQVPIQGLTGIGVVTVTTLLLAVLGLGMAVIVSWFF